MAQIHWKNAQINLKKKVLFNFESNRKGTVYREKLYLNSVSITPCDNVFYGN